MEGKQEAGGASEKGPCVWPLSPSARAWPRGGGSWPHELGVLRAGRPCSSAGVTAEAMG